MSKSYPLDISAIIHLASMAKNHSSSYRFAATLTEEVNPETLQVALDHVVPRFPTIAAGIQSGFFNYKVVPVKKAPKVRKDKEFIATFSKEEIEECAFRVLYEGNVVSLECFHALTDGFGAITFLKTLLAEYFALEKEISVEPELMILDLKESPKTEEVVDDYYTYAKKGKKAESEKSSYQIQGRTEGAEKIGYSVCTYDIKELLQTSRGYGVSLNLFLATVMIMTLAELQKEDKRQVEKLPVQIMVPMNLRSMFPSKTLRNFILVAYTGLKEKQCDLPFEKVLPIIEGQLKEQMGKEHLEGTMAGYVALEKNPVLRVIPLGIKSFVVKLGHYFFGLKKSCLTFTNLGPITFPEAIGQYVEKMNVFLTPRESSSYNCGIITCGDKCHINFTRLAEEPILEKKFDEVLARYMKK